jgi:hypothetical protein
LALRQCTVFNGNPNSFFNAKIQRPGEIQKPLIALGTNANAPAR